MDVNTKQRQRGPLLLQPVGKDYLWGGRRLTDDFGKCPDVTPLAESWECSTHPDGLSRVIGKDGPGRTLREVILENPDYLGSHPLESMPEGAKRGELPILIKFIDAKDDLSVQVHPDDAYAKEYENGALGKCEMWYVLDAKREASIIYGFARDVNKSLILRAVQEGRLEHYLQKVPVYKDDVYFVEAGTVHAILKGTLILEVQESSNLTYRLYDYHRVGKDGKERALHLEKGLAVMNTRASISPRQPLRVLNYRPGFAAELLCSCRYFEVRRFLLNTQRIHEMVHYKTSSSSFHVLVCIEGCGVLCCKNMQKGDMPRGTEELQENSIPFFRGDTFFVPADSDSFYIHGVATFLDVHC